MKNTKINESEIVISKDQLYDVIHAISGWSYGDIEFAIEESINFQVDIYDAIEEAKDMTGDLIPDLNAIIETIYTNAVHSVNPDAEIDEENIKIYTNYLDSDLYIKIGDDMERVNDFEELQNAMENISFSNSIDEPLEESVSMDQFYTNMLK